MWLCHALGAVILVQPCDDTAFGRLGMHPSVTVVGSRRASRSRSSSSSPSSTEALGRTPDYVTQWLGSRSGKNNK
eukprot:14746766-Alexandrium_andersonii.AAC.1